MTQKNLSFFFIVTVAPGETSVIVRIKKQKIQLLRWLFGAKGGIVDLKRLSDFLN